MYSITWLVAIRIEWPKFIYFYSRHMQKQECLFVNESELVTEYAVASSKFSQCFGGQQHIQVATLISILLLAN